MRYFVTNKGQDPNVNWGEVQILAGQRPLSFRLLLLDQLVCWCNGNIPDCLSGAMSSILIQTATIC